MTWDETEHSPCRSVVEQDTGIQQATFVLWQTKQIQINTFNTFTFHCNDLVPPVPLSPLVGDLLLPLVAVEHPFLPHNHPPRRFDLAVLGRVGKGTAGNRWIERDVTPLTIGRQGQSCARTAGN